MPRKPKLVYHNHGCTRCHARYGDTCTTFIDGLCYECKTGQPSAFNEGGLPRPCCQQPLGSRLMTDKLELARYGLVGQHPWFICKTCSRTHPFDPSSPAKGAT